MDPERRHDYGQLVEQVSNLRSSVEELNTKLFGDRDGDEGEGRIRRIEVRLDEYRRRLEEKIDRSLFEDHVRRLGDKVSKSDFDELKKAVTEVATAQTALTNQMNRWLGAIGALSALGAIVLHYLKP